MLINFQMKRLINLAFVFTLLLCGCGTSNVATSSKSTVGKKSISASRVEMNEKGEWVLVAPNDSVVGVVYVESGSSIPDSYHEGYIRILSPDGLKIGYANEKGIVPINPCFFAATRFYGEIAIVVPFSEDKLAAATDGEGGRSLSGNELWGVIDKDGRYVRTPVYKRIWQSEHNRYIYTSPLASFWISEDGEIHGF